MVDHSQQKLTAREMVRAHAYPVLAAVSSLSLLSIAVLLIPQAVKSHRYNRCIDAQINPVSYTHLTLPTICSV